MLTKSDSMWLKKLGRRWSRVNWGRVRIDGYDYIDAMLVPAANPPRGDGSCYAPQDYKPTGLLGADGDSRAIKFGATIESGDDFLIVSCKWL